MSDDLNSVVETRRELDKISSSLCLAKWLQVTLHLHNGHAHSCHHPDTHKVPVDEIARDPSALHNTEFKKLQRRDMLNGIRPKECDYCWKIEDSSKDSLSDRHFKSNDPWARPHLNDIVTRSWEEPIDPTYLEVNFGNLCNMTCAYCSPQISSAWMAEFEKLGPYPTELQASSPAFLAARGKMPIGEDESNPYLAAFWKWWPGLYPKLKVLRVTGGEPLLSPSTFRMMDHIVAQPPTDVEFCLNTNLMVPRERLDRFIEQSRAVMEGKKLRRLSVYTSIDSFGKQAEYIRSGLRSDYFWNNVETVLRELPEIEFVFMCTFNALSVTGFRDLLDHVLELKSRYPNVRLDISYLRNPQYLSVKILTANFIPMVHAHVRYMEENHVDASPEGTGFLEYEIEKMRRLYEWLKQPESEDWLSMSRRDFYLFCREYGRRRGIQFLKVFPEMSDFWRHCENLVVSSARARENHASL